MNTELVTSTGKVSERLAEKYKTDKNRFFDIVKATCKMEKATAEQFEAFLLIAEKYDLNPIMKQMWAYPDRNGGITHMVSIDGWIKIVNSNPQFDGYETSLNLDEKGYPISATCTMYRKDRSRPYVKTIYTNEWKVDTSPVWKKMPCHFAEMRAFIQCARICFNIDGINDSEVPAIIENGNDKYPDALDISNKPKFKPIAPEAVVITEIKGDEILQVEPKTDLFDDMEKTDEV